MLGVDRATVFRWRIPFEVDRRATTLLPRRRGRPQGVSQIDPRVEELIDAHLRSYYLQPERPSIRSLIELIHTSCAERDLPKSSWRAIKLRIQRLDARTKLARREGAAAARAIFLLATQIETDQVRTSGIDRSMPIVAEDEQIADRRRSCL
ncbi:MAG TPA: hypothetical protein VNW90_18105 [Acetobacteraceae bacterium]|jgi:putative transposase|nr:hypothetical protein [Acetobacteraceae bacterium]